MTKQHLAIEVLIVVAAVFLGIGLIDLASHIVIWLMKLLYLVIIAYGVFIYHQKRGQAKAK
jgi:Ca2+/Na+ antiporter